MKRIDKFERIQLKRVHQLSPLRNKRRQARDEKSKRRQKRSLAKPFAQPFSSRHFSSKRIILPKTLSLATSADRNSLVDRLSNLRFYVSAGNVSSVIIDFSKVEELHPCGTILLVAEIERLLEDPRYGLKLKATYPECEVVEQLFQYINVLEKLGCPPRVEKIDRQDVVVWLYESGVEGNLDSIVGNLPALLTTGSNMELRMAVNSGMAEAIANSSEHAYIFERADGLDIDSPTKWWLFARKEDDEISLVICDLGVGIPGSLPLTWGEDVKAFAKTMIGKKREDHQLIKFAMKLGRSRTNLVYRGQGLKDILKVVQTQKVGRLGIYSNCGVYNFDGPTGRTFSCSEPTSILGTVVQWRVPVAAFNQVVQEGIDE